MAAPLLHSAGASLSPEATTHVIVNSLRTGNVILDTCMALCLSAVLAWCISSGRSALSCLGDFLVARFKPRLTLPISVTAAREIVCVFDNHGDLPNQGAQRHLQTAIAWYLTSLDVKFHEATVNFDAVKTNKKLDYSDGYEMIMLPRHRTQHEVADGVFFSQEVEKISGEKETTTRVIYNLTCNVNKGGAEAIDKFLRKALKEFQKMRRKVVDTTRYVYTPRKFGAQPKFERHPIDSSKSFESMFFEGKEEILQQLQHFMAGTGRYAIKGFPRKLGILLHGPPGTGKTTFVKALSEQTGRHVLLVPLSEVPDNIALQDLMHRTRFTVEGDGSEVFLPPNKIIYFFDDVDASSDVVRQRSSKKTGAGGKQQFQFFNNSAPVPIIKPAAPGDNDDNTTTELTAATACTTGWRTEPQSRITLDVLLQLLDGLGSTDQRIVIMCTNHPRKLDKALVRPGRMDRHLFFGPISVPCAMAMLKHYYPTETFDEHTTALVTEFVTNKKPTPARLEGLCSMYDRLSELAQALPLLTGEATFSDAGGDGDDDGDDGDGDDRRPPVRPPVRPPPVRPRNEDEDEYEHYSDDGDGDDDYDGGEEEEERCPSDHVDGL